MSLTLRARCRRVDITDLPETSMTVYVCCQHRNCHDDGVLPLKLYAEVFAPAAPGRNGGVLPSPVGRAAVGRAGRTGRADAQGPGRARTAAADVPDRLPPRRRGVRV